MSKDKTALVFYGGVNEIGGNKVLLEGRKDYSKQQVRKLR